VQIDAIRAWAEISPSAPRSGSVSSRAVGSYSTSEAGMITVSASGSTSGPARRDREVAVGANQSGLERAGHDLVQRFTRRRTSLSEEPLDDAELHNEHAVPDQHGHVVTVGVQRIRPWLDSCT